VWNSVKHVVRMSIPTRVWTVIYCRWSEGWFAGLPTYQPLADQLLNYHVAEEKGEYTGKGKDPPKDCFYHALTSTSATSTISFV